MTKNKDVPDTDKHNVTGSSKPQKNQSAAWNHTSSQTEASALKAMLKKKSSPNDPDTDQT